MSQLVKEKKFGLSKLLSNTFLYIDDLCFRNYQCLDTLKDKKYPSDLVAERSGENLDALLKVTVQGSQISVYHKFII